MTLYAKSDGTTLEQHTEHVVRATEVLTRALLLEITEGEYAIAVHGAALHDLGKGHPHFQASLAPGFQRDKFAVPHRHELSSLLFLPLIEQPEWPQIIDMVVAHHKSLGPTDPPGKGLLDLVNEYGPQAVFDRHSENWEAWHLSVLEFLPNVGMTPRELRRDEIRAAFDTVLLHCQQKRQGRNQWRGLLMAADHLASALQEETALRLEGLFQTPDLSVFADRAASADSTFYPLAKKPVDSPKPHTLVIAPTGAGKTDFLMRRCQQGRIFYLLPFQASINAMFLRFGRDMNPKDGDNNAQRADIRRIHAASQIEIEDGEKEEVVLQRHPGAAVKVMTPHQIAALVFGLPGHESIALDVARQHVILDEVHVYNDQSQAMVLALVKTLVRLGCHIHIGSATIPTSLASELRACLGGETQIDEPHLEAAELESYDRHTIDKVADEQAAQKYVRQSVAQGKRILFLSNRVATAQKRYQWVRHNFPDITLLLIHSRFRRGDRARLEKKIEEFERGAGPCIVCSTQVIEVSLDISFDTLVTDCAPLDSLIQRFGRVNRRRKSASERAFAPVAVIAPPESASEALPYALPILLRTWEALPDGDILREISLQEKIDVVYPTLDLTKIDVHLIESDFECSLPQLCHRPRSVLLDALEIDSACVVRECDREVYQYGSAQVKQELEIPVPRKSLHARRKSWPQEEKGHKPFICPDTCYDEHTGLWLDGTGEPVCIIL